MLIYEYPIEYYVNRLKNGEYFCFPGYSDAEFYSMMGIRIGDKTGLGQVLSAEHGQKLLDVMKRRQNDPNWLFAIPKCLWELPVFQRGEIDKFLYRNEIEISGYERDMVLDDLAREAGLYPFIKQLRTMPTVLVGPKELNRKELFFLGYNGHIPIPSPNLHTNELMDEIIDCIVDTASSSGDVFLISAGVSAPIIIDRLYDRFPNNFYIDCGSIWDAFVGIGGQREWRAKLSNDPVAHEAWKRKNIYGNA